MIDFLTPVFRIWPHKGNFATEPSKHFAETCGRSGRGKVNDSRRVRSGDGREVRGCVWLYATGRVDEEESPGVRRIGGLPRLPAFPLSLLRYRGEQTRSGPTLEINCPN